MQFKFFVKSQLNYFGFDFKTFELRLGVLFFYRHFVFQIILLLKYVFKLISDI